MSNQSEIDTVALGVPTHTGRFMGKRLTIATWEDVKASGRFSMPDFHLITDLEGTPIEGTEASGAHRGYANGFLAPDLSTWRRFPWDKRTALVIGDPYTVGGDPVEVAPRWILRRQLERLAARGLTASGASELEFYLFRTSYEDAATSGYRRLKPAFHRHGDNDLLVDGHLEPVLGDIRRLLPQAGVPIELSQGEGGVGQFEVTLQHTDPLEMADRHMVYKHGTKAIAQAHDLAATFIAKVADDQAGSGCHFHLSLRDRSGRPVLVGPWHGLSDFGRAFVAGLLRHTPDLCLLFAPYANSYRRLQPGAWAPTNVSWGIDNRTTLIRICGAPADSRVEFRLAGADVNPYLAFAGIIAAGMAGVDASLGLSAPVIGHAGRERSGELPLDLREAASRFAASSVAERAFGAAVRSHIARLAQHEADLERRRVTDRDLERGFETA